MSLAREDPLRESRIIDSLDEGLRAETWSVEREPSIGSKRPDLVVRDPSGHTFVVEVKVGLGAWHFGSLALMSSLVSEFQEALGKDAVGVLVTDRDPEPEIAEAAGRLGIQFVSVGSDEPASMASHFAEQLGAVVGA